MRLIFFLAVLAIPQPANTNSHLPWSFLYPDLQWHGFAVTHCGVGARHVKTCLRTSSRKWKHGISRSSMPSFFVLNSMTVPPQHMENFSKPLEMMQCQEHKPFAGTKCFLKAEPLLKMSSAANDHQQHGQVTTQHEYENFFDLIEDWQSRWLLMKWMWTGKLFVGY